MIELTIIIPAKNEAAGLRQVLPRIREITPNAELLVIDDGSTDDTCQVAQSFGAKVHSHPVSMGNGAAIKSGARIARGQTLVFMDADGQHKPSDIPVLLDNLANGFDMVVGARSSESQAGAHRALANGIYNRLATWMVGKPVLDLTSGFRAVNAKKFRQFQYLLPNGFSYPTTITMSFFRAGYSIAYVPIFAPSRIGKSHIGLVRDGIRFFLIIFKVGTLYSPLKLFVPVSAAFFLTGLGYYIYTFFSFHRFTNMSALMFISAVQVFLMGLVSEQISALNYKDSNSQSDAPSSHAVDGTGEAALAERGEVDASASAADVSVGR